MRKAMCQLAVILPVLFFTLEAVEVEITPEDFQSGDAIPSGLLKAANEAYDLNMRGLDLLQTGDLDAALKMFLQAEEKFPGYSDAHNNRGVVYYRRGNVGEASKIWRALINHDEDYALAYYNMGMVSFHQKQYSEARSFFEKSLKRNKGLVDAQVMLGRCAMARGNTRRAESLLAKAYRMNKDHEGAWGYYAYALIAEEDTSRALSILEKHRDNTGALQILGGIAAARKETERATDYFTRAYHNGGSPELLLSAASLNLEEGKCEKAQNSLQAYFGSRVAPSPDAYLWAGVAAKECGEQGRALDYFRRGVQDFAADPLLRFNLGKLYFQKGSCDEAIRVWKPLRDTFQDPNLYYLRSRCYRKQDNLEEAERSVRSALSMHGSAMYHDFLGVILYENGKRDDARREFKKALSIDPGFRSAQLNLSLLGAMGEDVEKSIQSVRQELEKCRDDCAALHQRLAVLYHRARKTEKAVEVLEKLPAKHYDMEVFQSLAFYYRELHQWTRAVNILEGATEKYARNQRLNRDLVQAYLASGMYGKAIGRLERMIENESDSMWRLRYQLGYAWMELNQLDKARQQFQESLSHKNDFVAAKSLLAYIHSRKGETEAAEKLWKEAIDNDPQNRTLLINLGLAAEHEGDYDTALDYYRKAEGIAPEDRAISLNIGNALDGLGKTRAAEKAYTAALDSEKRSVAAYNLFVLARKQGESSEYRAMADILTREFPETDFSHRVKAELAVEAGDSTLALKHLKALTSRELADWYLMAEIYLAHHKTTQARECLDSLPYNGEWKRRRKLLTSRIYYEEGAYERALELWSEVSDTSFGVRYNMALAAFKSDNLERAYRISTELAETVQGESPDAADLYRLAANTALRLERWDESVRWHQQLLEGEEDPLIRYNLAVVYYNKGEIEKSWEAYRKARAGDPSLRNEDIENRYEVYKNPPRSRIDTVLAPIDQLYNQAVQLQSAGRDKDAESIYRDILDRESDHARSWNNLGTMLAARGELEEAEKCYERAVKHEKNLPESYANLINLLVATEKERQARKWISRGVKAYPGNDLLERFQAELSR